MLINVTKIKSSAQTVDSVDLQEKVDAAAYDYAELNLTAPLVFHGTIENAPPYFHLKGELTASLELVCSRCLAPYNLDFALDIEEAYTNKPEAIIEEDDEIGLFEGDDIDITPALLKALFMELPMHPLCRPDCRGICPDCGADLNQGECACNKDNIDLRLEKLKSLFDKMNSDKEV